MPNWRKILDEVKEVGGGHDIVRRKYLKRLSSYTGRNVIVYYSGWLQKGEIFRGRPGLDINDSDKNGFMATVNGMDRAKGLDLILHTPGGDIAAAESIVDYLHVMFNKDIRAIVPQLAMSAGTMIACACRKVVLGKHSNLGPIDPQVGGMSAHAILETWAQAKQDITNTPQLANLWMPITQTLRPGMLVHCKNAIDWSEQIVKDWLVTCMFEGDPDADAAATKIVETLGSHAKTKNHSRHISRKQAADLGFKLEELESDQKLQDLVLTVHHACVQTLSETGVFKIMENQNGVSYLQTIQQQVVLKSGVP